MLESLFNKIKSVGLKLNTDKYTLINLDSTKLKIVWKKKQHFFNDAFQSYNDLFQTN